MWKQKKYTRPTKNHKIIWNLLWKTAKNKESRIRRRERSWKTSWKKSKKIIAEAEAEPREIITEKMVEIAIKIKKASDRYGWKAEWIKNGGKDMSKSLTVLYNRIEEENCVPEEWVHIKIKVARKNGKEKINENQRGLFLMNIVANVYEKEKKAEWKNS